MKTPPVPEPLVSVVVVAYNSGPFITETLNSILTQSYAPIELIISDDGSKDNTRDIASAWIENYSHRFQRVALLTVPQNTGLPSNCNRGIEAATGTWIKLIAADDLLLPNCITDNMAFAQTVAGGALFVQSRSRYYKEHFDENCFLYEREVEKEAIAQRLAVAYQYHVLKWAASINAPTVFIKKEVFDRVGLFDPKVAHFEDWPMWLKISRNKILIHTMPKATVCYRVSSVSISNTGRDRKIFSAIYHKLYQFSRQYLFAEMSLPDRIFKEYEYFMLKAIDNMGLNRDIKFFKLIFVALTTPSRWYSRLRLKLFNIQ